MFSFLGFPSKSTPEDQAQKPAVASSSKGDREPMFPAQNSIQRAASSGRPRSPPPPLSHPTLRLHSPDDDDDEGEEEDDENGEDLLDQLDLDRLDLDTLALPHSTRRKPPKPRKKVQLMPGFSQLDWAKLKASGTNLRGESVTDIRRITRAELGEHRTKDDAWASFHGKVYNMTPYLDFHPGGVRELMRVAGKDGTELFMKTHAWISVDGMLDSCLVGFLVND